MNPGRPSATVERETAAVENAVALLDEILEEVGRDVRERLREKYPEYPFWQSEQRAS